MPEPITIASKTFSAIPLRVVFILCDFGKRDKLRIICFQHEKKFFSQSRVCSEPNTKRLQRQFSRSHEQFSLEQRSVCLIERKNTEILTPRPSLQAYWVLLSILSGQGIRWASLLKTKMRCFGARLCCGREDLR